MTSNEAAAGASASINGGTAQIPALGTTGLALLGAMLALLGGGDSSADVDDSRPPTDPD
jgi:hypothetical protein